MPECTSFLSRSLPARWLVGMIAVVLLLGMSGCGTNLADVLYQTAAAAGRTYVDLLITDVANDLADAIEDEVTGDDDTADGDDADGDDDGDDGGDDADDGGAADGATLYANNCAACHGADGASGFAPDVTGLTADELAAGLESASHGSISLTDEEVAAIAEFLGG